MMSDSRPCPLGLILDRHSCPFVLSRIVCLGLGLHAYDVSFVGVT